jgi:hypothetical protein
VLGLRGHKHCFTILIIWKWRHHQHAGHIWGVVSYK